MSDHFWVRLELPSLGLALGDIGERVITVYLNNRVYQPEVDAVVFAPVKLSGDADAPHRYVLRDQDPQSIVVARVPAPNPGAPQKRVFAAPAEVSEEDRAKVVVNRELWTQHQNDILVLQLRDPTGTAEEGWIKTQIEGLLQQRYVERCVIPYEATGPYAEATDELCFAVASCQYTAGMIDRTPVAESVLPAPGPADVSYARLAKRLRSKSKWRPTLMILTGDQVYVDATAGLFDPSVAAGRYESPYEQLYASVYYQNVSRQIPVCAMLDDHEIEDNWENEPGDRQLSRDRGVEAFRRYVWNGSLLYEQDRKELWNAFQFRGFDFFFADTRTEREMRTAEDLQTKHIMSQPQREALEKWAL
jgi:hypothetical protein